MKGLEPPRLAAPDPKSGVSTNFTTSAEGFIIIRKKNYITININSTFRS